MDQANSCREDSMIREICRTIKLLHWARRGCAGGVVDIDVESSKIPEWKENIWKRIKWRRTQEDGWRRSRSSFSWMKKEKNKTQKKTWKIVQSQLFERETWYLISSRKESLEDFQLWFQFIIISFRSGWRELSSVRLTRKGSNWFPTKHLSTY